MDIKKMLSEYPVRTLSALMTFGGTLITILSTSQNWSGPAITQITAGWTAFIAFVGTFITHGKVVPVVKLDGLIHNTIVALADESAGTSGVGTPSAV